VPGRVGRTACGTKAVYETVNFCDQSQPILRAPAGDFVQPQTLAPGLTGQVLARKLPDTQYTSVDGCVHRRPAPRSVFFQVSARPFTSVPDLLGRLEYRKRRPGPRHAAALLRGPQHPKLRARQHRHRQLTRADAAGWGFWPETGRFSQCVGCQRHSVQMSSSAWPYYGPGASGAIFGSNTFGQDAAWSKHWPAPAVNRLHPRPRCRRMARPQPIAASGHRSGAANFVYSYAWQQYPSYAPIFSCPDRTSATLLNSNLQQGIVNLIWSPFAEVRGNTVGEPGGLRCRALEYVYIQRDVFGRRRGQTSHRWRRFFGRQSNRGPRLRHCKVLKAAPD